MRKRKSRRLHPRRAKRASAPRAMPRLSGAWFISALRALPRNSRAWFAADAPAPPATWRYLPHLLIAAFIARAAVALAGDFRLHPDEIMQYLEPAHHAVFGNGVLYWEYLHGGRSWLIPGFAAGILVAMDAMGLGRPALYVPAVELGFCLLSLLIPWAMYRITQQAGGERAARLALLFGCFWYEFIVVAHKPFAEFSGSALLLAALALMLGAGGGRRRALFAGGALLALAAALRMQYAPAVLLLLAARSLSLGRAHCIALWGGVGALAALVGILEWRTWGAPFHSYMTNFLINYYEIFFSDTGGSSRWRLPGQLLAAGGLVPAVAFTFGARLRGPARLLLLVSAVVFLLHMLPEHREYRFIFLLTPCWLMLLAMLLVRGGEVALRGWRKHAPAALLLYGALALANVFPWQPWVHLAFTDEAPVYYLRNPSPEYAVVKHLASQDDVRGVYYTLPFLGYHKSGGYYYLHHDVPFYTSDAWVAAWYARGGGDVRQASLADMLNMGRDLASHIVTDDTAHAAQLPEFSETYRAGNLVVWRRNADAPVPGWRANVPRVFIPYINRDYGRLVRRLRGTPLGWFLAERYWPRLPARVEFAARPPALRPLP